MERVEAHEQVTAVVRGQVSVEDIAGFLGGVFGEVMAVLGAQGVGPAGPPFARYEMVEGGFRIEAGFPAAGPVVPAGRVEVSSLPGGEQVQVMHRGPYAGVAAAWAAAEAWIAEQGLAVAAPPWESYLDGPEVEVPRTLVHIPVRPA